MTLDTIESHAPSRLAITHFGVFDDVAGHLERLRATMLRWAGWVADGADEATFVAAAAADLTAAGADVDAYRSAAAFGDSYAGLERYWRKLREREQ
jgi:hypothetical protein